MSPESRSDSSRLDDAYRAIDSANADDPQVAVWRDLEGPRELVFSQCVCEWVWRLNPQPSEILLLAARAHTLKRWEVPRSKYEMNRRGYHEWREVCARHHADVAQSLLKNLGFDTQTVEGVLDLILKKNWPADPEAQALEDADCLAFLEMKLANYVGEWEGDKALNILRRTLKKMTPQAREMASTLDLDPRAADLLRSAMQ